MADQSCHQPKELSSGAFPLAVALEKPWPKERLLAPYLHHELSLPRAHCYLVLEETELLKIQAWRYQ